MPFTIGEIPIGSVVDGELVLRDIVLSMETTMPSTPVRGLPMIPEQPRQTTMAIGEEDGGRMMPPRLPGGVPGIDFFLNEQGVQTNIQPPPRLPGGVPGIDFFLNEQGVQTNIQPVPQLPGGVRPPAMQEVCVDAMKNGVPIKQCSFRPVESPTYPGLDEIGAQIIEPRYDDR